MKSLTAIFTAAALLSAAVPASASEIDDSDPCTVTMCMFGMATGTAGSECSRAIAKFFSISVVEKGVFMPWKTLDARKSFLGGCSAADSGSVGKILDKFGTSK